VSLTLEPAAAELALQCNACFRTTHVYPATDADAQSLASRSLPACFQEGQTRTRRVDDAPTHNVGDLEEAVSSVWIASELAMRRTRSTTL
jgi:hypothetical protein